MDTVTITMRDFLTCRDPQAEVLSRVTPPIGSVETRPTVVDYDPFNNEYLVSFEHRFPMGQLSMGLS